MELSFDPALPVMLAMTGTRTTMSERAQSATARRTDAELAELCQRGERSAYEELYRRHGARMKSIAWNLLRNTEDAEDAIQETFLKLHRSLHTYTAQASFSTWLYRILINTCTDALRTRKPQGEMLEETLPARTTNPALKLALESALQQLDERRRTVFLLAEVEGLSHAEIGEILGVATGTSKGLLFEARRTLRELLTGGGAWPVTRRAQ